MRELILKVTFIFSLSATIFALPNEIEESTFGQFFEEKLDVFCSPENSNEPFKDLVSNLYVFTCSSKKESESFCKCINKIEKNITTEDADKITERVQNEIIQEHAKEQFIIDKTNDSIVRLENMFHLMDLQPALGTGYCINPNNHLESKDPIVKDMIARQESYFNSKTLGAKELRDRELDLTELIYTAEAAFLRSQNVVFNYTSSEIDDSLDEVVTDVIIEKYAENNGYLFKSDFMNSDQKNCGNMREEYTNSFKNVIKEYIRIKNTSFNTHVTASPSMQHTMLSALSTVVNRECRKADESLLDEFSEKSLGKKRYKSYLKDGKTIFFEAKGLAKMGKDNSLIDVIKSARDKKIQSNPNIEEIEELEEKFYYDVAYCHLMEKFETTEKEVVEKVAKDGTELANDMQEILSREEVAEELQEDLDTIQEDISIVREKLSDAKDPEAKEIMGAELSRLQKQEAVTKNILRQEETQIENLESKMAKKLNGEDQFLVYRSSVTSSSRSLRYPISRGGGKIKIDSEVEMEDRITRHMNAERDRLKNNKVFNAHDNATKEKILDSAKKEQEKLIEMNGAFSSGDPEKIGDALGKNIYEEVKNTNESAEGLNSEGVNNLLPNGAKPVGPNNLVPGKSGFSNNSNISRRFNSRPYNTLDRVIKNISPRPATNEVDRRVDEAITALAQRNDNSELTKKAKEVKDSTEELKKTLAPLQESLDSVLKQVEKESKEIEAIKESVNKKTIEQRATKKIEQPKVTKPTRRKNRAVKPTQQARRVQQNKSIVTSPLGNSSPSSTSSSNVSETVDYTPQARISLFSNSGSSDVGSIKSSLQSGAKVVSLAEFSKMSDSDFNVKSLDGVGDTFILDNGSEEVLVKTVYDGKKPVRFEIVGSATKAELAKSLIQDKIEINDKKMELYNYDEFMDLIRKSQK
jgi:hypothetical protein